MSRRRRRRRRTVSAGERPLGDVLARAWRDFTPERPERAPWHQESERTPEHAHTGNIVTVPLKYGDRVQLHGLDRPSWERDELEPRDWFPAGWGIGPPPT